MRQPIKVKELLDRGVIWVEDGNHGENRPLQSEFSNIGTPFIRPPDLMNGFVNFVDCDRINERARSRVRKGIGRSGDILFTHRATVGRIALAPKGAPEFVANPGVTVWRSLNHDLLDIRYLYYFMQTSRFMDQVWSVAGSTDTFPYISLTQQRELELELPEIEEQRIIGKVLGSLDDKIELNRQMNETLEAMAQAIFRDWFVDFGPTRRKLEGATDPLTIMGALVQDTGRAQALADLFPAALTSDGLPEGWSLGVASSLVEFNPKEPLKKGTPAPYSDMSSLPTSGPLAEPPVEREYGSGMRFRNGDALLARITPCLENGKSAFVDFLPDAKTVGWGSTEFYVLRSRKGVPAPFAYLLVRHPEFRSAAIASMSGTSGRQRAQVDRLEAFPLAEVPLELLGEFGKFILPLFEKITANGSENRTLAGTRDLLLPKLMSGEIRLSVAEELMEAAE